MSDSRSQEPKNQRIRHRVDASGKKNLANASADTNPCTNRTPFHVDKCAPGEHIYLYPVAEHTTFIAESPFADILALSAHWRRMFVCLHRILAYSVGWAAFERWCSCCVCLAWLDGLMEGANIWWGGFGEGATVDWPTSHSEQNATLCTSRTRSVYWVWILIRHFMCMCLKCIQSSIGCVLCFRCSCFETTVGKLMEMSSMVEAASFRTIEINIIYFCLLLQCGVWDCCKDSAPQ